MAALAKFEQILKLKTELKILLLLLGLCGSAYAQGFINLDFESATIVRDTSSQWYPNAVYTSNAMPGWTVTGSYFGQNDVLYDNFSLGAPAVTIYDTNGYSDVLGGKYSIVLYGGAEPSAGVSISQTGLVPAYAQSLSFKAVSVIGTLLVSLGGQSLAFFPLATYTNYTLYGASIPAGMAGQSEQLMFNALPGNNNNWLLDDIQFSSSSVPEPGALGLGAAGGMFLAWLRWRNLNKF